MDHANDFSLASYDFDLPKELIAQYPPRIRGSSRLLVLNRGEQDPPQLIHGQFCDLISYLPKGALLVGNDSRVLEARLLGVKPTGGKLEFLLITPLPLLLAEAKALGDGWMEANATGLTKSGSRLHCGERFFFGPDLAITITQVEDYGLKKVVLSWKGDLAAIFASQGHIPLPPYLARPDEQEDKERYQTVYAKREKNGSVAAPTAGLHFTKEMQENLCKQGFGWETVTLYVGYGTFSPVRTSDIRDHIMHEEYVEVSERTCQALQRAKKEGRPVIAVGTTSLRALEGMWQAKGKIAPFSGTTKIYLYPGKPFHLVDGLLTNFHLPESSLIILVSAFAGRKRILHAYEQAIACGYRFFSYGDAMLILPDRKLS